MAIAPRTTTHMGISEARANLTSVVNEVFAGETRIVVEKSGIPVAAVVSPNDLARLDRLDRKEADDWAFVEEISARFADVSEDELMQKAVESVREVRAEKRAQREAQQHVTPATRSEPVRTKREAQEFTVTSR